MSKVLKSFLSCWYFYAVPILGSCVWLFIALCRIKWMKDEEEKYREEKRNIMRTFWKVLFSLLILVSCGRISARKKVEILDMIFVNAWALLTFYKLFSKGDSK